jgi:hypothetical protein
MLNSFITTTANTFLATLPIFPSEIIFGQDHSFLEIPKEDLNF